MKKIGATVLLVFAANANAADLPYGREAEHADKGVRTYAKQFANPQYQACRTLNELGMQGVYYMLTDEPAERGIVIYLNAYGVLSVLGAADFEVRGNRIIFTDTMGTVPEREMVKGAARLLNGGERMKTDVKAPSGFEGKVDALPECG